MLVEDPEQLGDGAGPGPDAARELVAGRLPQACAAWGVEPDPKVLAFDETYEGKRADLQRVAAE